MNPRLAGTTLPQVCGSARVPYLLGQSKSLVHWLQVQKCSSALHTISINVLCNAQNAKGVLDVHGRQNNHNDGVIVGGVVLDLQHQRVSRWRMSQTHSRKAHVAHAVINCNKKDGCAAAGDVEIFLPV